MQFWIVEPAQETKKKYTQWKLNGKEKHIISLNCHNSSAFVFAKYYKISCNFVFHLKTGFFFNFQSQFSHLVLFGTFVISRLVSRKSKWINKAQGENIQKRFNEIIIKELNWILLIQISVHTLYTYHRGIFKLNFSLFQVEIFNKNFDFFLS